jgi:hypothetical protein
VEKWLGNREGKAKGLWIGLATLGMIYLAVGGLKRFYPAAVPFDVSLLTVLLALVGIGLLRKPSQAGWAGLLVVMALDGWLASRALIRPALESEIVSQGQLFKTLEESAREGERLFAPYKGLPAADLVAHRLNAADGYDSFQLAHYTELMRLAIGCDYDGYAVTAPATQSSPAAVQACPEPRLNLGLLAALNARYLLLESGATAPELPLVVSAQGYDVYDLGQGLGRGFGVGKVQVVDQADCFDRLAQIDARTSATVEAAPPIEAGGGTLQVEAWERSPNRERFRVRAEGTVLFVRSESWAPGWGVRVDGDEVTLLRADCALQGAWVTSGVHEIVFEYRPRGFVIGRAISLIMLAGLVLGYIVLKGAGYAQRF